MGYKITYKIKKESIIMQYNKQSICFNSFGMPNKKKFNDFKDFVMVNQPQDLNDVFKHARQKQIYSGGSGRIIF